MRCEDHLSNISFKMKCRIICNFINGIVFPMMMTFCSHDHIQLTWLRQRPQLKIFTDKRREIHVVWTFQKITTSVLHMQIGMLVSQLSLSILVH